MSGCKVGKIRSRKSIVEALEDSQLAIEEYKLAGLDNSDDINIYKVGKKH